MSLAADQHIPEMEVAVGSDDGCSLSSQTLGEELNSYTVRDKEPVFLLQDAEPQTTDESPRLSAASSSSTDKLSGTEYYDSDRPVSVLSTTSSSSYHEGCNFYESVNGGTREDKHFGNGFVHPEMELMASAAGSFHAVYREMQNGVKGSSTPTNSNTVNRLGRMGSRSLSPFGTKVSVITHKLNYVERVVMEILETERMYVQDLRSIVEDYLGGIIDQQELLPMKPEQVSALFGNIEDIYEMNSELLQDLDNCKNDPVAVASCFVEKSQDFDIYTQYCTNYPNSVATLTECMRNKVLAKFFRDRQELLNHSLPLGSYLLKPVQRILKYHLLLQEIAKHFDMKEEGYEVVEEAIETMTGVAWYINDMKRKHEHAVRLQEIQSLLLNWKGLDLTTYGELVLEGTFRVQRARSERCFFLFDKALFITKKRGDHFIYKTHIPCSSLMLIESARDSLCFSVTHYKNSKQQHNLQAKTMEEKHLWTHHIKKLILENHHAIIPQKAKEAILEMDSIYSARYRYSPERLKKTMSTIEPGVTNRSGRRQSEPSKHILKQLGEKVGLKHAGSDGVLLEFGDTLQPSINDLATSLEQPQADEKKEQMANTELNTNSGAELSASEDEENEEIHLGDDQVADFASSLLAVIHCWQYRAKALLFTWGTSTTRELVPHEAPKGFKRQNSQCSGNAEKRRSVEVNSQEIVDEMEKENSEPNEMYGDLLVSSNEMLLAPSDPVEENHQVEEQVVPTDVQDPVDNVVTENTEEIKTFSSEEDEEETTSHESDSILPPSVLDQASVIAERFINNMSRRSSLAIDDGKVVGYITPRLTSRSSSAISLDKIPYQNGPSDLLPHQDTGDAFDTVTESALNKMNSVSTENVFEERERQTFKRRESILSIQDRQLLDKIKTYYDNAEHQDAQFSIKRRESLTYIPAGLVRNSVFKINSLPRSETLQSSLSRQRMSSSSSNASNKNSRHSSWSDVPSVTIEREPELPSSQTQLPLAPAKNGTVEYNLPISDEEFKSPGEMIKVWDEIEKVRVWNEESMVQKSKKDEDVTSPKSEDIPPRTVENGFGTHEPLIILEDSDLSTIAEESPVPTPESTSPNQTVSHANKMSINEQDFKTPIRIHPKIMQLANCMNEDMSEKMKNKVYQLARQYSQRIKANKPIPHRQLREIEEDLRRGSSLPSVEEEKQEEKGKLKPTLSLPAYDHIVLQEHSPTTPTSASFREKSPKRLSFSNSCDSPETASPVKSDCRSPLSPVNTEKFHWPDVRELRSRYIGPSITGKTLPVNRSHSVPDKMVEHEEKQNKANISHSHSMNVKCTESVNCKPTEMSPPKTKTLVQVDQTSSPKLNIDLGTTLQSNRASGQGLDSLYYISAEAPLENNKKVIVVEKVPLGKDIADYSTNDLENDDTFVHIRSPTTREKISIKAVIERCKAYQDSEEYRRREGSSKTEEGTTADLTHPESSQEQNLLQDGSQQTRVKNLREKFQSLKSSGSKHTDLQ